MAISSRVTTITKEGFVPTVIDGVLNSNVFLSRLFLRDTKVWNDGYNINIPLQYQKPTTGGTFTGLGDFDTALQTTRVKQTFTHSQFYQNVSLAGAELSLNSTTGQVLSLIKTTMAETQYAMLDSIGTQAYGLGAGDDFLGLEAIVDDGTNTSTYGGLTRTTYTALNSQVTAASGGAISFTNLATVQRGASAAGSKQQRPTIAVTTETVWDLLESLFTPTTHATYDAITRVRMTTYAPPGESYAEGQALEGQFGFQALRWRGLPFVADEKCTSGVVYMLNEEYLHWYNLKGSDLQQYNVQNGTVDSVYGEYQKTYPIQWKDFVTPSSQYGKIGQFIMMGNIISGSTRRHGKLTGVTTT